MAVAHGAHGSQTVNTFLIDIYLPNGVKFQSVQVTEGNFSGGDILIGMDIINSGDFAVTNYKGVTKFTFRFPSFGDIDFVKSQKRRAARTRLKRRKKSRKR